MHHALIAGATRRQQGALRDEMNHGSKPLPNLCGFMGQNQFLVFDVLHFFSQAIALVLLCPTLSQDPQESMHLEDETDGKHHFHD